MMPRYKVTEEKVNEVKRLNKMGLSQRDIARRLDISQYSVWHALRGSYGKRKNLNAAFRKKGFFENYRPVTI
jgi:DNA invertase Pin-like site-specific DNA recombinase